MCLHTKLKAMNDNCDAIEISIAIFIITTN